MVNFISFIGLLLGAAGAAAATSKQPPTTLQIGIKEKADPCLHTAQNGDNLKMHYVGSLFEQGTVFDSSRKPGRHPFTFKLGANQVISGWEQGVLGMCQGERRKVTIPPAQGYGNRSIGPIPAGSTLVFDIELLDGATGPGKVTHEEL
ncbi:hypothetical protein E3P77_03952 [Wallemia ichthyophaga]|uniref:peptidylprolyl isomerase n=2 Tax=Wallemia ichthyophaga TaxID=245174 RepID=A0A4T0ILK6_WALIC|nr:protein 2B [Wallemia ichthyophaga EXF-994]TIA83107.1 hypothetical protein E3P98_00945 [Wallemia ichthyophaga]EOR03997.1 protein 2B [Wallemia ichthyophaga EXF-994]TIA87280.1 hypothetical protein E3P97_04008 [Wallemia ichthyophaga]TIA95298.1 hypothetical protein E3P96_03865 [Wallemia ichthyophaga]TIB01981.1 hypothetical protein E3P95_01039 [Wallemia ichthyophaga]